jgi:hypothetical protein
VLYLGEINDSQNLAWRKSVEAFLEDQPGQPPVTLALLRDQNQTDPRLNFLSEGQRQRIEEQQKTVAEWRQSLRSQDIPEDDVNKQIKALQGRA